MPLLTAKCLCVFCVGPLCDPQLRWWVLCGVLPSVWVNPPRLGLRSDLCLCVFCVGPLCGPPLRWWVFCGVRGPPLCVGPLWVGASPVVFPFPIASSSCLSLVLTFSLSKYLEKKTRRFCACFRAHSFSYSRVNPRLTQRLIKTGRPDINVRLYQDF